MPCLLGENRDVFFPKLDYDLNFITFSEIATRYLESLGYVVVPCASEEEARRRVSELKLKRKYPVYFIKSDTTGEKDFEEFNTDQEILDMNRFDALGLSKMNRPLMKKSLAYFMKPLLVFVQQECGLGKI